MPILTPTKDDGATTKAHKLLYVEPGLALTEADLAAQLDLDGLNAAFMADLLSAVLTHERCGVHLYRSVAARTRSPMLKERYEEFGGQTHHHVEILERLIGGAGGNPAYVSPLARAVEGSDSKLVEATFLITGGIDLITREMAMLDAVFLAETIDQANWQTLTMLADALPDGAVHEELQGAITEVIVQEDEHLDWARDARAQLTLFQATVGTASAGMSPEDQIAAVRGWFASDASP